MYGPFFTNLSFPSARNIFAGTGIHIAGDIPIEYIISTTTQLLADIGIEILGENPIYTIRNAAPDQIVVLNEGTAIEVTGTYPEFTITNTEPDQEVELNDGTGIDVTGTYPNFTITNTAPDQTLTSAGGTSIIKAYPVLKGLTASGTITLTSNTDDVKIGTLLPVFFQSAGTISTTLVYMGQSGTSTTEQNVTLFFPQASTVTQLFVRLQTAPGVGTSRVFTLRKAIADTALVVTISDLETTGSATGSVSYDVYDQFCVSANVTGAPSSSRAIAVITYTT